jgi:endo-1,4-beta-xylanase
MLLITFTAAFSVGVELNETLRAAGARRGLYIGSQFKGATIQTDAAYRQKHSREFSLSTVGNMCKWHSTHPSKETFDLEPCVTRSPSLYLWAAGAHCLLTHRIETRLRRCNEAFAYARSAGQQFRGHNLCWGNDNPSWLENGKFTAAQLESLLRTHITHVMRGVKAAANGTSPLAWDVVNEATNDTAFFKPNTWYPALPSYVDIAFSAAREADPSTLLFYNDYSVAAAGGKKSEQMYYMVQSSAYARLESATVWRLLLLVRCSASAMLRC